MAIYLGQPYSVHRESLFTEEERMGRGDGILWVFPPCR